ncbi:hypothetical protein PUNSTDRAFT_46274 [Punctularia strigosozonata HHB-11173 SS5]|uniref:uncharacterized protein n=1 Tax=Punctularia strigosozonata (strain HHB-11173) TaxID=741275 RepID=UPI0004417F0B|nr:uncharacterized protein PUNSTDRAFT_46274 [Punctularia strigosozonata HHB-11173 SS5]EIN05962.1 hypothetical protein PUNSTDRAFT_46274 [Punctularia strigosozonata HHB-11173 SS5]
MLPFLLASLTVLPTAFAAAGSPVSSTDIQGIVCGIQTYGKAANWPQSDLNTVQDTLALTIDDFVPQPPTPTSTSSSASCTVTAYADVATAIKTCTDIHLRDITVPAKSTLDLSKAKANSVITFEGRTTWGYAASDWDMLKLGGTNITVQGAPCSVIDGNGAAWWDGQGSNGGVDKPDHMIVASKLLGNSVIKNLYVLNAPTHVFDITGAFGLWVKGVVIDMKDGYSVLSNGLQAGHNTDGFDISSSTDMLVTNNVVFNQDDCVAVTSGGGIVTTNMFCNGGHGLSIGSIGGKSNNTVNGVIFSNSKILNSQNGARIKTNSGTTGTINNVTYSNIQISNISIYGIDIQQDYLNGGPTGVPTNGVTITDIFMSDITGTVQSAGENYYLLTASDTSASSWKFSNLAVTGGHNSTCLVKPSGFSC